MKKIVGITLAVLLLVVGLLAGCGEKKEASDEKLTVIKVGASTTPHAEILGAIKDDLKAEGYDLQVKEFTDYVLPNLSLNDGSLDANYFQHQPYLDDFNKERDMDLVAAAKIHYEPLGIYSGRKDSLDKLEEGDSIAIPNDATNEARALLLLQDLGLLKLKKDAGMLATPYDIVENPKNLKIEELDAAQVAKALPDVAFGVINGNNALLAGLNASKDAIAMEAKDSLAADTFANVLAVRSGSENSPEIQALVKALQSDTARKFIEDTYEGAVVPVF
ncbi:MetQ/NlpA family ABC transporter substrate-binding protein [Sinanaerobacter sp. ZZT-01]|uniref:MetQ/NlpA family ABC transporter substrate-binding protein n=1 Tax=Sinanaerobacter sp. ZZT-01 TaxID=3111540 RepID=UPI002D797FC6|nr:MetQ/NlpA family ABC transporter substrate-binding protein [Sinanaerobacter sp. ZZT-01]WRR92907.1 MetQ/NlpA family ABC transporter substrate-binding protein [Sinanaerobacter sp. ZZT-01]